MALMTFSLVSPADASDTLPETVSMEIKPPLAKVGSGTFRKYGFRIYIATLWAPGGVWDPREPYALELRYMRSLSKDTIVDAVTDDIRDQGIADEETLARWSKTLADTLPAIEEDDVLIGLAIPGKHSVLYHNNTLIARIDDPDFSRAFFNIWLGEHADQDMKNDLLGRTS